jgi:glycosyltransferase involved in cell wall biosynthesis
MLAPAMVDSRVITPGVDLSVFRPGSKAAARHRLDIPQESAVVVFVANQGRHNAFKDYPTMRSAMLRLADEPGTRPITLYCIGDAADDERRGRLVIRHVPYVRSSERLADFYRAADVYLHAARLEAFGLTIAEAMACGVPVVASRVGGIPEVFIHDRHGYCVPPGDAGAMADAVSALLGERGLRQQMGMRACDYAHEVYDQERMIDAYLAWFLQHVGKDAYLPAKRAVSSRDLVSYRTG